MSRVLIVSNRLPITVRRGEGALSVERSPGGLATGLRSVHEGGGWWIGWPGFPGEPAPEEVETLTTRYAELRLAPVTLTETEVKRYYEDSCNGVLWPLFHSFHSQLPLESADFALYREVNARFADAVLERYQPGDVVWVHDYQLLLVPRMVRERRPDAVIGFFLHIPFPPPDTFRTLPAREAILDGMLAADLVGFHTAAYMRNFASSVLHVLGAGAAIDAITWQGRTAHLGVFPMGVDARAYEATARTEAVEVKSREYHGEGDEQLLVGIDRLDYTKGIPRRLLAYEWLLAQHEEARGKVRLVQVAVPSRTNVDAYAEFRSSVDELVGRINGRFGTPRWAPVHYVYRGLGEEDVVALYRAADVLLVTPIRDGMNLVAKEFVAARHDEDGVLLLSEFAGAAAELGEAVHVNPYDVEGTGAAIWRALSMPRSERRTRMQLLRRRVFTYDVFWWASTFLETLEERASRASHRPLGYSTPAAVEELAVRMRAAPALVLMLDYDGTLVPIMPTPELARPDERVLELLTGLGRRPGTEVHIVSGRGRDTMEAWLGGLPVHLHAEHGLWTRLAGQGEWTVRETTSDRWRARALEIFEEFAERTPGSMVEQKRSALAWHFRLADPEFGPFQANELKVHLSQLLSNEPVEVLAGDRVVELRPHGANKGRVAAEVVAAAPPGAVLVALGDDRTDEDMFAALPADAITVHIGPTPSVARWRIRSVGEVRALLASLTR